MKIIDIYTYLDITYNHVNIILVHNNSITVIHIIYTKMRICTFLNIKMFLDNNLNILLIKKNAIDFLEIFRDEKMFYN